MMNRSGKLFCFFVLSFFLFAASEAFGAYGRLGKGFVQKSEFEAPEAFEKIYVNECQVLSTPQGTFLKHCNGRLERVRALLYDYRGMYVLRVLTQCQYCGRVYDGKESPEGYSCPLYEKELVPGIWGSP